MAAFIHGGIFSPLYSEMFLSKDFGEQSELLMNPLKHLCSPSVVFFEKFNCPKEVVSDGSVYQ